jgi:hypothetical protein
MRITLEGGELIEVLLVLSVIFSALVLVGLLTMLGLAIWFIRQMRRLGNVKLIVSQQHKPPAQP